MSFGANMWIQPPLSQAHYASEAVRSDPQGQQALRRSHLGAATTMRSAQGDRAHADDPACPQALREDARCHRAVRPTAAEAGYRDVLAAGDACGYSCGLEA